MFILFPRGWSVYFFTYVFARFLGIFTVGPGIIVIKPMPVSLHSNTKRTLYVMAHFEECGHVSLTYEAELILSVVSVSKHKQPFKNFNQKWSKVLIVKVMIGQPHFNSSIVAHTKPCRHLFSFYSVSPEW